MKLKFLLLFGIVAFFLACEKEAIPMELNNQQNTLVDEGLVEILFTKGKQWDALTEQSAQKDNPVTKKLKIRTSGTMSMTPGADACEGFIQFSASGEGNATHLGLFTLELDYCTDGTAPLGPIFAKQTAANGDQVLSVVVGGDPTENSLDFLIYGGTGRFENATGFVTLFFVFDYLNQTFDNFGEGTITY
ncbi:hypothetical protein FK220_001215 [Flavobacteriaceae bacterium TP-CH-4]|uniref:Lipoprotein n=1 Tax=Pelagihabitans pacificus TaxID=2696054 RepID=A0A967AWK3_9FLAO|nr:hypothetical protein [Pelagihabitans pacificus]NHF57941.1 hypothetical protein [Pelagihabitans pacificus]